MDKIKTNIDVLRAMTDEELSVFLKEVSLCEWFDSRTCLRCQDTHGGCPVADEDPCIHCNTITAWLQSPTDSEAFLSMGINPK